ncbi:MAG: glycosyltransferase [Thermoleophilaceae bacterium]|jgi:hypothetical protein
MTLEHYLLTNFNVKRDDLACRPDLDWLKNRFELFERYCLPSVAGQICRDFTWLIRWDDEGTPASQRDRLLAYAEALPLIRLVPERIAFHIAIARSLDGSPRRLLTTRLDNDDALHRDAVALLQREAGGEGMEFLNMPLGYCLEHPGGRTFLVEQPHNPFVSLAEDVNGASPRTAVCVSHHDAAALAPVRQVGAAPSWLQVIHGRNAANEAVGEPCDPPDLRGLFNVAL